MVKFVVVGGDDFVFGFDYFCVDEILDVVFEDVFFINWFYGGLGNF